MTTPKENAGRICNGQIVTALRHKDKSQMDIFKDIPRDEIGMRELPDADALTQRLWGILHDRWGEQGAILFREIREILFRESGVLVTEAHVCAAVRWLIMKAKKPIAAGNNGYFLFHSEQEKEREFHRMWSRGVKSLARASQIKKIGAETVGRQIVLALRAAERGEEYEPDFEHDKKVAELLREIGDEIEKNFRPALIGRAS